MTQMLMNHIPDYLDDRLKVTVVLSDALEYRLRSLANSNVVSSWYNPALDMAFTTTTMSEVPEEFRDKLVQHNNKANPANIMYPSPNAPKKTTDTGTVVRFYRNPSFEGESFRVWWDVANKPGEYETFSDADPISAHPHDYGAYGEYVIAFSTNVADLRINKTVQGKLSLYQNTGFAQYPEYFNCPPERVKFDSLPSFTGDELSVTWYSFYEPTSAKNEVSVSYQCVSVYTQDSPLSDYQHCYVGVPTSAWSSGIQMKSSGGFVYSDRPSETGLVFIKDIRSRNAGHQEINDLLYCRALDKIDCAKLSAIRTEWYDCYELTSINLPGLKKIECAYAVNCMPDLQRFYAPNVETLSGVSMFKGDVGLREAYFPRLTCILPSAGYTFMTNVSLSSAYMPRLVKGQASDFAYCVNLKKTDFRSLSSIENGMFRDCLSLKEISVSPECSRVGDNAFLNCGQLRRTSPFSKATYVGDGAFRNCGNLSSIEIPQALSVGVGALRGCSSVTSVRLEKVKAIFNTAFYGCSSLSVVDLSELDQVPELSNANAFTGCQADYRILVRPDMVDEFKTKTGSLYKWSASAVKSHITAAD